MNKQTSVVVTVSPVLSLLGIAFVVLKLCKVIAWSWAWVLAPFWVPFAGAALVGLGILAVWAVFAVIIFCLGRRAL